ncbi:MAG: spore coat protein [Flavobacteriaceae bacterium]|nr:spore coat protein [Flavobacteriaceae bacterium]
MFYVFEMANNHQGSVSHAKSIIDQFSELAESKGIMAAVKLQFRQLDTFIHQDYKKSDLKYVKRFNDTRLSKSQFSDIVSHIHSRGLVSMATPFDNESIPWLEELDISVVKIASCSIDDWPLLEEVSKINKRIIISTAGASSQTLRRVYSLFKSNNRDFAFMHCVGEYPTDPEYADMARISKLKEQFPDIEIGFSTHESPHSPTLAPIASAMGCTILEKHVGVETEEIKLNGYSNTPEQMSRVIDQIEYVGRSLSGVSTKQNSTLETLKRGIYLKKDLANGEKILKEHLYYALPVQDGCLNASHVDSIVGKILSRDIAANNPVSIEDLKSTLDWDHISEIKNKTRSILEKANIPLNGGEKVELSCHFGLSEFSNTGALIIDKVNREYCKKLIVMFPGQKHPVHHHIKKEEAFELLYGDCILVLNDKEIELSPGKPVVIPRGAKHSFSSARGCVIEEISTTHIKGDSVYQDPEINKLSLDERKIKIII